ncbi:MAG: tRNA preQ1(34) S-adenosylmethionine ribosyltransferase-isomerase QueA [Candidatus Dojkabacteria bacterium]|jgi:S-adenosylmethionine:tRNA ribosyltransferase-isomerase|nr:tRNA preQ1(34) S-adenosylmethionine ribosyltransferase-isomerase QueA [Candidatus Dojkabacteria bacterium]
MNISEFKYNLPEELIAKYPPTKRGTTNLLVLEKESGDISHRKYFNIPEYIKEGDIVVLNETKVLNSRTYFLTPKGKRVEVLFLEERGKDTWYCLIGRAKNVEISNILKCEDINIEISSREGNGFLVKFLNGNSHTLFEKYGHTPLPPYMKRDDESSDRERYNTVFSSIPGAVAAPTASLNLTDDILGNIKKKGGKIAKIELKIGWGTFAPIREENIEEHEIHKEYISVSKEVADMINGCKGRVWAFGTTVARTLESIYSEKEKKVLPYSGYTDLYIYPGYNWNVVDFLVTNFHMPDSSLILLVSSFAGSKNIKKAYAQAIESSYKFLSYGDSMLIGANLSK